jgi:hypothetical protein
VCDKCCSSSDKDAEITAVPTSSSTSAVTEGSGYRNLTLPSVLRYECEGIHVQELGLRLKWNTLYAEGDVKA